MSRKHVTVVIAVVAAAGAGFAAWRATQRGAASIRNPGFESGLDGWTPGGRAAIVRGAATAHDGDASVSLPVASADVADAKSDARISQEGVRVAAGRTYRLSVWAQGQGAPTLEAWVVRSRKDRFRAAVWPAVPGRWTQFEAEWTATREDDVRIDLIARAGEAPVPGALLIDDVSVTPVEHAAALDLTGDAPFDDEPSVARGPDGSLWVAWMSWQGGDTIRAARLEPAGDTFTVRGEWLVDGGPKASLMGPRVVAGPRGVALVYAAERGDDWQIVTLPLTNDGPGPKVEIGCAGTASAAEPLTGEPHRSDTARAAQRPTVTPDAPPADSKPAAAFRGDALWIAWESNAGGERQIWADCVVGGRADEPIRVGADGLPSWTPTLAVTADGRVAVAWHAFDDGNTDVMLRVRTPDGVWEPVRRLTHAPTIDRHPVLCAHGDDVWIAWENANSLGIRTGHTVQRRVEIARVTPTGLETPVGGLGASPLGRSAECPSITFDDAGRLRVAFLRPRRVDHAWQVWTTTWDGAAWSAPAAASPRKGLWRTPGLAVDGDDLVVAFQADDLCTGWSVIDRTAEARSSVYVTRVRGAALGRAAAAQFEPLVEPADPFEAQDVREKFGDADPLFRAEATLGAADVAADGKLRLYFGDLHEHSDISICGKTMDDSPDVSWQSMRDFPHLDFGAVTDHGENFNPYLWNVQAKAARLHDDPGRFVAFLGEEWTSDFRQAIPGRPHGYYGHRNLVFGDLRMPRWWNPRNGQTPKQVWEDLRATGSDFVVIPHQLADIGNVPTDWTFVDESAQPVVEMYQHRGSYESVDAPRRAPKSLDTPGWYVHDLLARGLVFGMLAAPDHGGAEGKACVWAPELSRGAILDALRARRCYATTGPRILLDVRVNDRFMGTEDVGAPTGPSAGPVRVRVHVECPGEIEKVEVCRDGVFHSMPITSAPRDAPALSVSLSFAADAEWTDAAPPPLRTWTYVRVTQKDGEMAWSSPVWLGPRAAK